MKQIKFKVSECTTTSPEECFKKRQKVYTTTLGVMSIGLLSVALIKEIDSLTNEIKKNN